jgi:uncharacterized protein (TIGR02147 family)
LTVFEFEDYKKFVLKRLEAMPKKGRGEMLRIAESLRMHSTRVSHIFKGKMNLTLEQACGLAKHLGLSALESEYFLLLVNLERAGSEDLKQMLRLQGQKIRAQAKDLVNRVPREKILTEEQKAVFYSSWFYSGIRLATSIPRYDNVDALADRFQMPREKVRAVVDFLLATGLCAESDGHLQMGSKTTHLEHSSPLVLRHHANWRLKALARHESLGDKELAYTCPVSVTLEDQIKIREMLAEFIEKFLKRVVASDPAEQLACLNIDWFGIKG